MPIATRPPEADAGGVATIERSVVDVRFGGESIGIAAPPPGALLPSGGTPARDPVPAPSRALAPDALRLLRRWHDPERWPAHWSEPAFEAEVESVRAHLAPVRTRRSLAASFGREAFHVLRRLGSDRTGGDDPGPVRVAYALRWIELGSDPDRRRP